MRVRDVTSGAQGETRITVHTSIRGAFRRCAVLLYAILRVLLPLRY